MVCKICNNALQSGWQMGLARAIDTDELTLESRHRIAHHENLGDLAKSASEACRICLRFWDVFNHDIKRHISDDEIIKAQVLLKRGGVLAMNIILPILTFEVRRVSKSITEVVTF